VGKPSVTSLAAKEKPKEAMQQQTMVRLEQKAPRLRRVK